MIHLIKNYFAWLQKDNPTGDVESYPELSKDGETTECEIYGSEKDARSIPEIDIEVDEKDIISLGDSEIEVVETPGHTSGHICFYLPVEQSLFCGDTLFSVGCGRIFEGSPEQMYQSLEKLKALPDDTKVYPGHEYTLKNIEFALTVNPENEDLIDYYKEAERLLTEKASTIPSTIGLEKKTNPFFRTDDVDIRKHLGMEHSSNVEVFAELRKRKDIF